MKFVDHRSVASATFDPSADELVLGLDDHCICGSSARLRECCFRDGRVIPRPAATTPPHGPVRFRNRSCYSGADWGCSREMSGEHPISESVLLVLSGGNKSVAVTGHPWQRAERQTVGIANLKSKVLCTRHNSALTELDRRMAAFFTNLHDATASVLGEAPVAAVRAVNGHDIERWMLKALCGTLASGQAPKAAPRDWRPPSTWLSWLWGARPWPIGSGLMIEIELAAPRDVVGSIYFKPLLGTVQFSTKPIVVGAELRIHGLCLVLMLSQGPRTAYVTRRAEKWTYRPGELRWYREGRSFSVVLGWSDLAGGAGATVPLLTQPWQPTDL